jgi:hypothetical protein
MCEEQWMAADFDLPEHESHYEASGICNGLRDGLRTILPIGLRATRFAIIQWER